MIYFFADHHFGQHCGKHIFDALPDATKSRIVFRENDLTLLSDGTWVNDCELLILHLIGETSDLAHADTAAGKAVKRYCERGGDLLLLHGSSAAFWQWSWWRKIVGLRWVRPGDPDNAPVSTHPHAPCTITPTPPNALQLKTIQLPFDEIYIHLQTTAPTEIWMQTQVDGETFPQCGETLTPWGGKIVHFIPGHLPVCTENPDLIFNVSRLIDFLMKK